MVSADMVGTLDALIEGNPKFMAMLESLSEKTGVATNKFFELLPVFGIPSIISVKGRKCIKYE